MANVIAANVVNCFLLHEVLASVKSPLDELSRSHLVVMEIPPAALIGFENTLLRLVARIQSAGTHVAIVVQPNLRRRTHQPFWVQRWNRLARRPMTFHHACSCQLGNYTSGVHNQLLVGCTFPMPPLTCSHAPTLGGTPTAMMGSLEGVLSALCVHFLVNNDLSGLDEGCDDRTDTASRSVPVPQRTPDSAHDSTLDSDLSKHPGGLQEVGGGGAAEAGTCKTTAYPTDSKEREKIKRNKQKELGEEVVVKKRKFHVEDHYDDCGDDLSSLGPMVNEMDSRFVRPCDYDTDQELSDQDHNECLLAECQHYYPVDPSKVALPYDKGPRFKGRDPRAKVQTKSSCPACRNYRDRDDWEHTRVVGECSFPRDMPVIPECVACQDRKPRLDPEHTYEKDKCRWAASGFAPKVTRPARPHTPVPRVDDEPTAHARATRDGVELGAEGEERVAQADRAAAASSSSSSSSAVPAAASGSGDADRSGRGPDQEPRVRRSFRDQGENPENPDDWSSFDIGKIVRLFRTTRQSAIRLSLRKLHVRWWHASKHTMHKFLERVGVNDAVLRLIPEICDTCKVCREWQKPAPSNVCSTEFADTFNQQAECDLLFIGKHIIFHMLDRCTRWHAAMLIDDKKEETLMGAIDTLWISTHGAPKELIVDGETGIAVSAKTTAYLARKGTKLHVRAKDQHARFVERRGALLRDSIHRAQSQLREEGIQDVPFRTVLAEAVFAGNALLTVNGSTPIMQSTVEYLAYFQASTKWINPTSRRNQNRA